MHAWLHVSEHNFLFQAALDLYQNILNVQAGMFGGYIVNDSGGTAIAVFTEASLAMRHVAIL
jgi:hypothetical protein